MTSTNWIWGWGEKKEMQITCTFNPTDAEHFLNTDFRVHGDTETQTCLHTTYTDNRFVGEEYKKVFDRLVETNPNYYNIYALGKRWVLEGLVFDNWEIIKEVPEEAKFVCYGQDFWFTNDPSALIGLYLYNNDLILDEVFYERGLMNVYKKEEDKERSIVWLYEKNGVEAYDNIFADSSEPKSIEEIFGEWYNIKPVVKWADSIKYWIDILKQYNKNNSKKRKLTEGIQEICLGEGQERKTFEQTNRRLQSRNRRGKVWGYDVTK